jgi:hypothetical protein
VLRHVADALADVGAAGRDVEVEYGGAARRRLDEPEQDLDQRGLPGTVRADEADDPGLDVDVSESSAVTNDRYRFVSARTEIRATAGV